MSRVGREPPIGGRNALAFSPLLHRRERSLAGRGGTAGGQEQEDESSELDLFCKGRSGGGSSLIGFDGLDGGSNKPVGVEKFGRSNMYDLLDVDMGKHDYDWLLTPPGSPHVPPKNVNANAITAAEPKRSSTVRSSSTTRTSRLSSSQSEAVPSVRPARSGSVTRASVSSAIQSNNNRTSVLNTSTVSVTSRPSTPGRRPATPVKSTSISHTVATRASTPVKTRSTTPGLKTTPLQNSRPATPTKRPTTANSSSSISSTTRPSSRPSTPTRQPIARAITPGPSIGRSPSVGRVPATNARTPQSAPSSRPSSPSPRPRTPVRPIDLPDFPSNAPPNLRTKLPERPLSAGRSRPGTALTVRSNLNSDSTPPPNLNRRISLPIVARSKFPENSPKAPSHNNGLQSTPPENHKTATSDGGPRRVSKPSSAAESTGFGRTISKKSLDMALRHMDIRQSMGSIRGASLFPQSIRSTPVKCRPARVTEPVVPFSSSEIFPENDNYNGTISGDSGGASPNVKSTHPTTKLLDMEYLMAKETANEIDLYGHYRYDMLLKEDSKSTNWLHSVDDKSDQSSLFDHRFEPLPEPFDPL